MAKKYERGAARHYDKRSDEENVIFGRNPVTEALKSGREVERLLVSSGSKEGSMIKIIAMAKDRGILS